MAVQRIKKDDVVAAIAGSSAGKTGKVLHVFSDRGRAIVEGLNLVKKTLRKSQDNPKGGITEKEASISISNLMLYCPECKKGVKISHGNEGGKSIRKCRKCRYLFDK